MQRDEIGLAKQILQIPALCAEFLLRLSGSPVYVVVQDADGEPAGAVGQGLPDPAEAHRDDRDGEEADVAYEAVAQVTLLQSR